MATRSGQIEAITLDFFHTLAYHRDGRGRGALLMEYLGGHGLRSEPWEHQVLYDVFEPHGREYAPEHSDEDKRSYFIRLTGRLFRRLKVEASEEATRSHAAAVWSLLGPASLAVYPDVLPVLRQLRGAGCPLAILSNWQCGLRHFASELGIAHFFDHILVSAELGLAKPDPRIFEEASRRLGVPPDLILHVGDTHLDDVVGARRAGLQALLLQRWHSSEDGKIPSVSSLNKLPAMLAPG